MSFFIAKTYLFFILLIVLALPFVSQHPVIDLSQMQFEFSSPSLKHFLGRSTFGQDYFIQLLWAIKNSLTTVLIALFLTTLIAFVVAYLSIKSVLFKSVLLRIVDLFQAIPGFLFFICFAVLMGPGRWSVVFALVISRWAGLSRVVRNLIVSVQKEDYFKYAVALGSNTWHLFRFYILKDVFQDLRVYLVLLLKTMIISEAALSFLGLGYEAGTLSLGSVIASGRDVMFYAPHVIALASLVMFLLMLSLQILLRRYGR